MREALITASARYGLPVPIDFAPLLGSTNAALRERADAPHGTALVADAQTAGRGRMGREWRSPPGANLHLSVLLRPDIPLGSVPLLVLAAAVAVVDACGPPCGLKWPNDVLAPDGRKVAGVLAELESAGGRVVHVIFGFGVNVLHAPPDLHAACLAELTDPPDRADLAARLVRGLLDEVERAISSPAAVLDRWRSRCVMLGRRVTVGAITGDAVDVHASGALLVRDARGLVHRVLAGDVEMVERSGRG